MPPNQLPLKLFRVNLASDQPGYGNDALARWGFEFCRCRPNCGRCDTHNTVNFAHGPCVQFVKKGHHPKVSYHEMLWQMLQAGRPLLTWEQACIAMHPRVPAELLATEPYSPTEFGLFMRELDRRLPDDIKRNIYELVPGLFGALYRTNAVYISIGQLALGPGSYNRTPRIMMFVLHGNRVKTLHASSTTILGEPCLTKISLDPHGAASIDVENRPIWGIQAALVTYGVCGIKVLYSDGSQSPWLGSGEGKLFNIFKCGSIGRLEVHSDVSGR